MGIGSIGSLAISVFIHLVSVSIYCKSRCDDRNRVGGTCPFRKESPSEPTKTLCEQKAAQTDSLAIEEMSVLVSNLPGKWSTPERAMEVLR